MRSEQNMSNYNAFGTRARVQKFGVLIVSFFFVVGGGDESRSERTSSVMAMLKQLWHCPLGALAAKSSKKPLHKGFHAASLSLGLACTGSPLGHQPKK